MGDVVMYIVTMFTLVGLVLIAAIGMVLMSALGTLSYLFSGKKKEDTNGKQNQKGKN